MPHVGGGGGDDLASSDEIKVFEDEGEEENRSSENLTELKSSLVTEGEEEKESDIPGSHDYDSAKTTSASRPDSASHGGKAFEPLHPAGPISYVVSPYPHHNGSLGTMASKVPMVPPSHPGSPLPFMVYNGEHFAQPPPAHMGIPPVTIDPKTGIPRPPVYHLGPPGQYPSVFSPDFTHQLQWHTPALYPTTSAGFRSAYTAALPVTSANLPRFSPPTLIPPYPGITGISHPALITPKQEMTLHHVQSNHRNLHDYHNEHKYQPVKMNNMTPTSISEQQNTEKKQHIKRPLNAFMLYMKEMRAKVVAECTLKESAAINQILGRRWHSLSREEQAKYYEMARKERQLHMQLYPGWSARDNYAQQTKKKKRKKDRNQDGEGNNLKKCRARFGLDQQSSWCKPCRRKKKCIRYLDGNDHAGESEDNMGSAGSVEAPTPDSKCDNESDTDTLNNSPDMNISLSSPQDDSEVDVKPRLESISIIRDNISPISHHHPLSVHHLIQPHFSSRSLMLHSQPDPCDNIPQLPTPPSTDSSTTTAPPMLKVT